MPKNSSLIHIANSLQTMLQQVQCYSTQVNKARRMRTPGPTRRSSCQLHMKSRQMMRLPSAQLNSALAHTKQCKRMEPPMQKSNSPLHKKDK